MHEPIERPQGDSPLAATFTTGFVHGVVLVGITGFMMFGLPRLASLFASVGIEVPAYTIFVIDLGRWVTTYLLAAGGVAAGFLVLDGLVYYHLRQRGATGWARAWWLFWLLLEGVAVAGLVVMLFVPLVRVMTVVP